MGRDDVIRTLQANRPALEQMGVRHAFVAGSYARGTQVQASDIDIVGQFDKAGLSAFDMVGIELRLEEMLGADVDLLDLETLPARVRQRIEAEAVIAF
jgi:predicted nucleotidyltransferase